MGNRRVKPVAMVAGIIALLAVIQVLLDNETDGAVLALVALVFAVLSLHDRD